MESIDLSEIQGSIQEIAREKALKAAQIINGPVFIEDVALCFDAFGDTLPGPYIKWFIKDMGIHNVYKMLDGWPQKKTAKAICTIGYCHDPKMEPVMFQGVTEGTIVSPRGQNGFGWDSIFQPIHESQLTYAEMPEKMKNGISHRYKAIDKFKEFLNNIE